MAADADSVLDTIKLDEMYALGNAWISLGDELHERRVAVDGHVESLGMTGSAGNAARLAWTGALAGNIDAAAETAWTVGQTIHRYADQLKEAADEYAKKLNAAMWADILGAILSAIFFYLGPMIGNLLSLVTRIIATLLPVIARVASAMGPITTTIAGMSGGAVIGAAAGIGGNIGLGAIGSGIAGTDYQVDWESVAWSAGIGGFVGGIAGGLYSSPPAMPPTNPPMPALQATDSQSTW
ncbi:hypothetical protein JGS22_023015 [Streptomyces sp. P38-E01]|uniref:Uncharacterized protein n=1 Tax=Streptomyces tardus TaxID=2780544 RepID=A0A949JI52_9ACTN|nr:hypothetical protein [Streptomyces tardus]MBU7600422.1 hypothetical protein [Streptomyces tardus]